MYKKVCLICLFSLFIETLSCQAITKATVSGNIVHPVGTEILENTFSESSSIKTYTNTIQRQTDNKFAISDLLSTRFKTTATFKVFNNNFSFGFLLSTCNSLAPFDNQGQHPDHLEVNAYRSQVVEIKPSVLTIETTGEIKALQQGKLPSTIPLHLIIAFE